LAVGLDAKRSLAFRLLSLLGVPLGHWCCTNNLAEMQLSDTSASISQEVADLLLRDRLQDQGQPLSSSISMSLAEKGEKITHIVSWLQVNQQFELRTTIRQ